MPNSCPLTFYRRNGISFGLSCFIATLTLGVAASFAGNLLAAEPALELLWPDGAPGAKGDKPDDKPSLTICLPEQQKANGAAVVICPGGGYGHLATGHEGRQIAEWLNSMGVAAFILEYRHNGRGYKHPAPAPRRTTGNPHGPSPRRRVQRQPQPYRHHRLFSRRPFWPLRPAHTSTQAIPMPPTRLSR